MATGDEVVHGVAENQDGGFWLQLITIKKKTRERLGSAKFLDLGISDFWAYEAYYMTVAHFY